MSSISFLYWFCVILSRIVLSTYDQFKDLVTNCVWNSWKIEKFVVQMVKFVISLRYLIGFAG